MAELKHSNGRRRVVIRLRESVFQVARRLYAVSMDGRPVEDRISFEQYVMEFAEVVIMERVPDNFGYSFAEYWERLRRQSYSGAVPVGGNGEYRTALEICDEVLSRKSGESGSARDVKIPGQRLGSRSGAGTLGASDSSLKHDTAAGRISSESLAGVM